MEAREAAHGRIEQAEEGETTRSIKPPMLLPGAENSVVRPLAQENTVVVSRPRTLARANDKRERRREPTLPVASY